MRALAAAGFVVLIVAAVAVIVRGSGYRLVVHAQIDQHGRPIPVGTAQAADPAGSGNAVCPPLSIAMAGALTGPDPEASINIKNGVQLAIEKHNTANAGCQVQIKEFDTGGDPTRVDDFAGQIVADAYTVGLIGPTFSGVAEATGALFEDNGLPAATASASRSTLSEQGWTTFFRAVASDEAQGRAVANFVQHILGHRTVCVVSDNSPYGDAMAQAAAAALGERARSECQRSIPLNDSRFAEVVDRVRGVAPDAVLRMGTYADAAGFLNRLRREGITSSYVSAQGIADEQFVKRAGDYAKDALLSCPCSPDPDWFVRAYREKFGTDPGPYSAEGYDVATIMLNGIDAGMLVRPQMLDWMRHCNGQGVARRYQWTETGELTEPTVWIYKVH